MKSETPAKGRLIARILRQIPDREAEVLRAIYLEGRTQVDIAADFRLSQPRVCQLKRDALLSLKRGLAGDKFIARRFMRGVVDPNAASELAIWDQPMVPPPKESREYRGCDFAEEVRGFKNHSLREAVSRLPLRAQQICYLTIWCCHPIRQVAKVLRAGINNAGQSCDASVSKIKRTVIQLQTGLEL